MSIKYGEQETMFWKRIILNKVVKLMEARVKLSEVQNSGIVNHEDS